MDALRRSDGSFLFPCDTGGLKKDFSRPFFSLGSNVTMRSPTTLSDRDFCTDLVFSIREANDRSRVCFGLEDEDETSIRGPVFDLAWGLRLYEAVDTRSDRGSICTASTSLPDSEVDPGTSSTASASTAVRPRSLPSGRGTDVLVLGLMD